MPACAPSIAEPSGMTLPFAAESAHVARDGLATWMKSLEVSAEYRDDARLVISELIGNAVRHARPLADGTVRVTWAADDGELAISVTDGGARTTPERIDAGVSDVSGRGLSIVEALASRWWVETSRSRTTVHALVTLA
ncbi:MAG: ATP-binding protein [Marmoricola sp.]|nr:ATP-binding protein [Marmoricola sp.]